jgi:hypothetical protein
VKSSKVVCRRARARVAFCLAVALTAAALIGTLVEYLANAGAFGVAAFTDRSNADVGPALCIGALVAAAFVAALARRLLCPSAPVPTWARRAADATRISRLQMVVTFGLQIAALFVMETSEQAAIWGHPLGGTIWLGGPIAISLLLHAIGSLVVAGLFSRALRWLAIRVAVVLRLVQFLLLVAKQTLLTNGISSGVVLQRRAERAMRRLRGRAPPQLLPAV